MQLTPCTLLSEGQCVLHSDPQNTQTEAWQKLLELIDAAISSQAEEFAPGVDLGAELWSEIVCLPPSIGELKSVKRLCLYASRLYRLPPEIGGMESLESLDPYTSHQLHWFPFEITQCDHLKDSRVSTRALFGNSKFRPHFPRLHDEREWMPEITPVVCSVCSAPFGKTVLRRWISLAVGTDVLPLLVNACSRACIESLPRPARGYVGHPHSGGPELEQPDRAPGVWWWPWR